MKSLALFLILPFCAFSQDGALEPTIKVRGLGTESHVDKLTKTIEIQGLENEIDIEFKNISDSISYELVGYDDRLKTAHFPKIRYTNISGGNYELRYKLSSQKNFETIQVHIKLAVWQKWWFWPMVVIYVLLFVGIGVYFFTLYDHRQKMKVQMMRNKLSSDLHDEVGSNLSSISIYTQVLKKSLHGTDLLPLVDKISNNSRESVSLMQDTVWALNPNNDNSEKLFIRIDSFAKEILAEKNISYFQNVTMDLSRIKLDMQDRKNLFLILKEGINNIAKHSNASKASMEVKEEKDTIVISLKDNGLGFDESHSTEGNGLRNFRERAVASNFKLEINSQIDQGTELILKLPH